MTATPTTVRVERPNVGCAHCLTLWSDPTAACWICDRPYDMVTVRTVSGWRLEILT